MLRGDDERENGVTGGGEGSKHILASPKGAENRNNYELHQEGQSSTRRGEDEASDGIRQLEKKKLKDTLTVYIKRSQRV